MEMTDVADLCDKTKQKSLIDALTRFKKKLIFREKISFIEFYLNFNISVTFLNFFHLVPGILRNFYNPFFRINVANSAV